MEFVTDKIHLYNQNFFDGIKNTPNDSFDLIIADPPYGASSKHNWNHSKKLSHG